MERLRPLLEGVVQDYQDTYLASRNLAPYAEGVSGGLLNGNPAKELALPARAHRQPRVLTEREYRRLQDACRFHPRDHFAVNGTNKTSVGNNVALRQVSLSFLKNYFNLITDIPSRDSF